MIRQPIALCATLLLTAAAAHAAPTKFGAVFQPSSCSACVQDQPAAAGNPTGSLLVAWEGISPATSRGVGSRFFRPVGTPKGADALAVAAPAGTTVAEPRLAGNDKGFVLVWTVDSGGDADVFVRRYSSAGVALAAPVQVNVDDPALPRAPEDSAPEVAMRSDGSFVVAWMRFVPFYDGASPGAPPAIFARRYSAAGVALAAPLQVSTGLVAGERPALCVATTGATTVAWTSIDQREPFQPSLEGVSTRRIQPTGLLQAKALVLAAPKSQRSRAAVACGRDGGVVVAWSTELPPADAGGDILAQRFSKDGKKAGGVFALNSIKTGVQGSPALAFDPTGAFVAAWSSRDGLTDAIRVRRFSAAGVATSADVDVIDDAGDGGALGAPALATTKGGDFTVVWRNHLRHLFGQRFKP